MSNKTFDSSIPRERNGEATVFLEIRLQRWPASSSPWKSDVLRRLAENPQPGCAAGRAGKPSAPALTARAMQRSGMLRVNRKHSPRWPNLCKALVMQCKNSPGWFSFHAI